MGYLDVAAGEVGYVETPVNVTKYWADLAPSYQGQPWCFAFVSWCLMQSGDLGLIGGAPLYYCPTGVAMARQRGQWYAQPAPGALAFFGFGQTVAVHVGFVNSVASGSVGTFEGNTSAPGGGGSQYNGDGVYAKTRSSGILGYWHIGGDPGSGFTPGPAARPGAITAAPAQTIEGSALEVAARFTRGRL